MVLSVSSAISDPNILEDILMTFRKDKALYLETTFVSVSFVLLCIICAILYTVHFSLPEMSIPLLLFGVLPPSLLLHDNKNSLPEQITIDETGILCKKEDTILWKYTWEQIAELRRGSRFRHAAIELILWDKATGKPAATGVDTYFLLGKEAKIALSKYYKGPIYWIGSSRVYSLPNHKKHSPPEKSS